MELNLITREMTTEEYKLYLVALEYLETAEELFGPRVAGFNFIGVFIEEFSPNIIYVAHDAKSVAITVTPRVRNDMGQLAAWAEEAIAGAIEDITKYADCFR
jgi:hypothetical protein